MALLDKYTSYNGMKKVDVLLSDFDSIRIVLYLDKYNPNVSIEELEENLRIDKTNLAKIIDKLIVNDMIKNENGTFRLSDFGKMTVTNLKKL